MVAYPVIPKGMILLRIIPTADHSLADVEYTVKCFTEIAEKLKAGKYSKDHFASVEVEK
jgi:glycine C-acetyltransferase